MKFNELKKGNTFRYNGELFYHLGYDKYISNEEEYLDMGWEDYCDAYNSAKLSALSLDSLELVNTFTGMEEVVPVSVEVVLDTTEETSPAQKDFSLYARVPYIPVSGFDYNEKDRKKEIYLDGALYLPLCHPIFCLTPIEDMCEDEFYSDLEEIEENLCNNLRISDGQLCHFDREEDSGLPFSYKLIVHENL